MNALALKMLPRIVLAITALEALRSDLATGRDADGLAIAHFPLLDHLQPEAPAVLHRTVLLSLAVIAALAAIRPARGLLLAAALLHTWSWSMSILDNYQHHYFVSIVLWLLVFFPARWAVVALSFSIATTYVWAAIAKLDRSWISGEIVNYLLPAAGSAARPLAAGAIALELFLAAAFALAPFVRARAFFVCAFLAASSFHAAAEWVLDLSIGAFSFYLFALAGAYLWPEKRICAQLR